MPHLVTLFVMMFLAACAQAEPVFEAGETGQVIRLSGPLSLVVETAQGELEVRLAGLDLPGPEIEGEARLLPAELVGQAVQLRYDGQRRDRYDRALAQIYLDEAGREIWLQAELVSTGQARVLSHKSNRQAAPALLDLEAAARRAGLGIWADPGNRVRDTHPDGLAQDIGSVQLVEGRVAEVTRLRSGRTYINFGLDYRTDFTIVVEAADEADFIEAGMPLAELAGGRIRVRGWLEAENGPLVRIDHPERIERVEG